MTQFIEKNQTKMEDAMEMLINSREIFHNYVEGERQDAAEQGRKEGEKIGEARGVEKTVVYFYKKGLIPRNEATAQLNYRIRNLKYCCKTIAESISAEFFR